MAKKQNIVGRVLTELAAALPRNVAFALGRAKHLEYGTAEARLLVGEGLARSRDSLGYEAIYLHLSPVGEALCEALEASIAEEYPEPPADPEPVQDEPTQPVPAPTFMPDPEPVPPAACDHCGSTASALSGTPGLCGDCVAALVEQVPTGIPEGVVQSLREQAAARGKS